MSKITDLIEKVNKYNIEYPNLHLKTALDIILSDLQSIQSEQQKMIDAFIEHLKMECDLEFDCKNYNEFLGKPNNENCITSQHIKLLKKITGKKFKDGE